MHIRTVKPDFFRHPGLFALEKSSGLPVRLAFEGLWCASDREGRFEWRPELLKLDILPWDEIDFGRVLEVLSDAEFIVQYDANGKRYGWIPSFHEHQKIPLREAKSRIPPPNCSATAVQLQCSSPATDNYLHGNSAREGKGREGNRNANAIPASNAIMILAAIWNRVCGDVLPKAFGFDDEVMKSKAEALLMSHPSPEYWEGVARRVRGSPFCTGDKDWKASFDWFLKPGTHLKAMAGNYDAQIKAGRIEMVPGL